VGQGARAKAERAARHRSSKPSLRAEERAGTTDDELPRFGRDELGNGVFTDPFLLVGSGEARSLPGAPRTAAMAMRAKSLRARADVGPVVLDEQDEVDWDATRQLRREYQALRGPSTRVDLRVVDGDGRPLAGVPVSLTSGAQVQLLDRTDEQGRASLEARGRGSAQLALGGGRWARRVEVLQLEAGNLTLERTVDVSGTITGFLDGELDGARDWTLEA